MRFNFWSNWGLVELPLSLPQRAAGLTARQRDRVVDQIAQHAPPFLQWQSRHAYLSRFIFPRKRFYSRCWRVGWLAFAVVMSVQDYRAEKQVYVIFNHKPQTPEMFLAEADRAVALFPLDQHLRDVRAAVRRRVADHLSGKD